MSKKTGIDWGALEKEYVPTRKPWEKSELEIIVECHKRGFPVRFIIDKGLLPGRTASSIDAQLKRIRNEKA